MKNKYNLNEEQKEFIKALSPKFKQKWLKSSDADREAMKIALLKARSL